LLNPTVGVRRAIARLQPDPVTTSKPASQVRRQGSIVARHVATALFVVAARLGVASRPERRHRVRMHAHAMATYRGPRLRWPGPDALRTVPLRLIAARRSLVVQQHAIPTALAVLLIVAAALNLIPGSTAAGTGSTSGPGSAPRLVVSGLADGISAGHQLVDQAINDQQIGVDPGVVHRNLAEDSTGNDPAGPSGPFLADGTLVIPVTVDTTVVDGASKLLAYRVRSGDTLTGIARHFRVSMMSIWWANDLKSKDDLHIGQRLLIPPVSGLVIKVQDGDTLDSISIRTGVSADDIATFNGLTDRNLIIGQTLIIPGAVGRPIVKPKPAAKPAAHSTSSGSSYHSPATTYGGGAFAWPVPGGYISQYFSSYHPAIDIAAPYGSRVVAAAGGTVVFAGWNNNGGGYQVWISHGSGLYTTYNHLSAVVVGVGARVGRGQQVGRVGTSGLATGPHCHFEVWRGYPWEGSSYRVNPLGYL
jgi:murein DD-endopeptidase MepM/ murein hydrolase activator NlpD